VARVGEKVPFAKKGRFGVVSGSVEEFFTPFHLQIETSSTDDLDEELLMQKVHLLLCMLAYFLKLITPGWASFWWYTVEDWKQQHQSFETQSTK